MAGSFKHVVTKKGKLRKPEKMLIENLGEAYEAIEEMYGMIWLLASEIANGSFGPSAYPQVHIEDARQRYIEGLGIAEAELKS